MSDPITPFVFEDELVSALLISGGRKDDLVSAMLISARHEDEVLAVSESGQCALPDEGSICIAGAPSGEWITLRNTEGNPQDGERCLLILNTFGRDQKMSAVSESGWSVQVFSGRKPRNGERYLLILNTFGGDGRGRKSVSTHLAREIFGGVSL